MAANQHVGKVIHDYILEERIGRGATADVYRARQQSVKRDVAIKIINPIYNIDDQQDFRQRFEREAKIIAALEHIHILPVHDYGVTDDGIAYIAMRLMRGGSLDDLVSKEQMPLDRAIPLFSQIASAIHYAHERGIVHRDIKPSNILLDEIGNAYVSDFGVAKFTDHASMSLTKTGYIIGAPAYCSPEQLRDLPVDRRSDVYALGVLLYAMLVGHTPYAKVADGVLDVIDKQIHEAPPLPTALRAEITPEIEGVILTALQKDPDDRFANAQAMTDALSEALKGRGVVGLPSKANSPRAQTKAVPPQLTSDRTLVRLYRLGIIVVILAIGLVFVLSQVFGVGDFGSAPNPTILKDERGFAADVVPNEREIRIAQGRMSTDHFAAYIACTLESQTQATRAREIGEYLGNYNIDFEVYDASTDRLKQAALINQALDEGAKALIICPLDDQVMREAVLRARREHVPVVFTYPVAQDYDAVMIEPDDQLIGIEVGREAGRYIEQHLNGRASVIVFDSDRLETSAMRMEAMRDGLLDIAPDAQIVGTYTAGADRDSGYATMQRILQDGEHFNVVLSLSDAASFGVIRALEEAGISPIDVSIFSVNGETLAQQYVREGYYMRATLQISAAEVARLSVDAVVRMLGDATLPEYILLSESRLLTHDILEANPQD